MKPKFTMPAFPSTGYGETGQYPEQFLGMSLRQWYVGLIAINEKATLGGFGFAEEKELLEYARRVFMKADALTAYERDEK